MPMKVPSKILPAGSFPVVDDLNVKGGIKVVASQAAMAAIPLYNLRDGALVLTSDTGELWIYRSTTSTWFKYRVALTNLPPIPLNKIIGGVAKDAFRSVATLTDLAELPTSDLETGIVCLVQDSGALYTYDDLTTTWSLWELSIGNIPNIPVTHVGTGLAAVALTGDYDSLINKPANASIAAEVAAREAAVTAEATARIAADLVLQTNVTNETSARVSADGTLTTNLASEATTRGNADTTLQANIDAEVTARANADTTLTTNLASEATARTTADGTLTTNLTSEATARSNADITLQANIDAEATARTAVNTRITNSHFVHDGSVSQSVHTVTHNLGIKFCQVTVYDSANIAITHLTTVTLVDVNSLTVTLAAPGTCTVVVSAPKV